MLPFFFRHYQPLVDHFFIHDNDSSDRSREICQQHGNVTVLPLVLEGDSLCQAAFEKVNQLWHVSRGQADWVAVCNIDEFFWHPDMLWYLEKCRKRGVSFVPSEGYEMVSETFPREEMNLAREIRFGARHAHYDKPSFFRPDLITDSGFAMARHSATPRGRVFFPDRGEVKMLHYKHLGLEYLVERHEELHARMRVLDREKKWGYHYDPEITRNRYQEILMSAREVVPAANRMGKYLWDRRLPRPVKGT